MEKQIITRFSELINEREAAFTDLHKRIDVAKNVESRLRERLDITYAELQGIERRRRELEEDKVGLREHIEKLKDLCMVMESNQAEEGDHE